MQIPPDASKYTRPHLPPIVSRDRLIARLREKGSANRVLLIGQAAQGKTTLAAAYAETIGGPAAWLHLEAGDGDRRRFFSLLVQALAQACPDTPLDRFRDHGAMAMGGTDSEARYGARLDALWALLADAGCVVLDGLDRLPGDAGAAFLVSRLLHLARSGPRLILTSRRLPAFSLQRWTVRRELLTVSNEELAFTPEEIGRYLEILHDLRVDPAVCETLHRVTGGWPGGLALLTQALERVPQDEWQRWLSARLPDKVSWAALRFFSEEVFSAQSPDIQDLLMRASLQEAIDPRLLDGGDADGAVAATLDELAARHLFIQRIHDDRGGTLYRMNGLFRRFLRGRFEAAYTSDRRRALRVETAERSAALERWEPAIRLWIEAGAIDAAAAGIRKIATDWVIRGRLPDLSAQLSSLPPDRVEADPWLFFFQVLTRRFRDGVRSIEGFRSALRRFTVAGEAGGEMLALAYLIESHVFYGLDPASCRPWIAKGERWLAERSAKPYFAYAKTVLWLQIGFAYVATGLDVSRGLSASQNAYLLAGRIGDGPLMVTATLVSVLGLAQAGQFERADEALRRIDSRVDPVVFAEYEVLRDLVHVELALHRGDLDVARDRLETMARGIDTFGLTYLYPALVDASGRCQVYRGDFSGAKDTCRHLRDVAVLSGSAFYEGLAHRLAGLIHYHQGRYPEAESALEDALRAFSEEDTGHLHPMRTRQILGVVLLHRDQLERADALLRQALAYFADSDHPLSQAETHVALGLLHHRRGEPNSARRHLTRAGRLSAARGLRHFIVLKAEDAELAARLAAPWLGTGDGLLSATDRGETPPSRPAVSASPAPEGGLLQGRAVPASDGGEALLEIRTFGGLQVTRRGGGPVEKGERGGGGGGAVRASRLVGGGLGRGTAADRPALRSHARVFRLRAQAGQATLPRSVA